MTVRTSIQSLLEGDELALIRANQTLGSMTAEERVRWSLENLPGQHVISSSFGIQSAVMLHLMSSLRAQIPVILIDTGFLSVILRRLAGGAQWTALARRQIRYRTLQ